MDDYVVSLWSMALLDATQARVEICQAIHRNFTPIERAQYLHNVPEKPVCPATR